MGPRHSRKILKLINWRVEKQTFISVGPDLRRLSRTVFFALLGEQGYIRSLPHDPLLAFHAWRGS
jgi:hypothetical protein